MRGGDVAAAEAASPRSPDLYDFSDDSDYAAAAAASDHTVLLPPAINSMLPPFYLACSPARSGVARPDSSIRSLFPVGVGVEGGEGVLLFDANYRCSLLPALGK